MQTQTQENMKSECYEHAKDVTEYKNMWNKFSEGVLMSPGTERVNSCQEQGTSCGERTAE